VKATVAHQNLLIELQKIDTTIISCGVRLANLPEIEQIKAIHKRLEDAAIELKVVETELEDVSIDLRRSEVDVEAVVDRMKKDEARLNSGAASPKELEQTQHELATLAKRKAELEDGELEIMMRFDSVKKRLDELASDEVGLKQLELELNVRLRTQRVRSTQNLNQQRQLEQRSSFRSKLPSMIFTRRCAHLRMALALHFSLATSAMAAILRSMRSSGSALRVSMQKKSSVAKSVVEFWFVFNGSPLSDHRRWRLTRKSRRCCIRSGRH